MDFDKERGGETDNENYIEVIVLQKCLFIKRLFPGNMPPCLLKCFQVVSKFIKAFLIARKVVQQLL